MFLKHLPPLLFAAVMLAGPFMLGGCTAATGAGAVTGIAAFQERGFEEAANDLKLEVNIADLWLNSEYSLLKTSSIEVYEGRALLTGVAASPEMRAAAVRLAWKVPGIKDVINEIQISEGGGFMDLAHDSWATAKLKSVLTFDEHVYAINYAIETVNGVVYLIGIAQNQQELDRVITQARNIEYVRRVISHVRLKDGG